MLGMSHGDTLAVSLKQNEKMGNETQWGEEPR